MMKLFLREESGATAIEYGLIVALIALAIVTAIGGTGNSLSNKWIDNANLVTSILQ